MSNLFRETLKRVIDTSPPVGKTARKIRQWSRDINQWFWLRVESSLSSAAADRLRQRQFDKAFRTGVWTGTGESVSGDGSSLAATEKLRANLPRAIEDLAVKTILDVPCGDWNWMSKVNLQVERYIGGDIVVPLIQQNQERFSDPKRIFQVIDLCNDELPKADLLLCRDALIHFSFKDILRAISNVKKAKITYIATTTFPATKENTDQPTGIYWRYLNLEKGPFSFPRPLMTLVDDFNRLDQILAFWRISDLLNEKAGVEP